MKRTPYRHHQCEDHPLCQGCENEDLRRQVEHANRRVAFYRGAAGASIVGSIFFGGMNMLPHVQSVRATGGGSGGAPTYVCYEAQDDDRHGTDPDDADAGGSDEWCQTAILAPVYVINVRIPEGDPSPYVRPTTGQAYMPTNLSPRFPAPAFSLLQVCRADEIPFGELWSLGYVRVPCE